jgi:hypothetical protein
MKRLFLTIILLISYLISFGQGANIEKAEKSAAMMLKDPGTYCYNILSNKYLTDVPTRNFHFYKSNSIEVQSRLIKTGRKDASGYEILNIEMYDDLGELVGKVVPNSEIFSLYANVFSLVKPSGNTRKTKLAIREYAILVPSKNQTFMWEHSISNYELCLSNVQSPSKNYYQEKVTGQYYCSTGNGTEPLDIVLGQQYLKDHQKLWKAIWEWSENKIAAAKEKSYDELIKDIKINECFLFHNSSYGARSSGFIGAYDSLKISYKFDNNGNVNEIIFHLPFIDNKYYDKNQFYAKAVKDPSSNIFKIQNKNNDLNIGDGLYIIPFEGRLLLCSSNKGGVIQIISGDLFDATACNLLRNNKLFLQKSFSSLNWRSISLEKEYQTFVQLKTFEQSYKQNKDILIFSNFLESYINAIKKK